MVQLLSREIALSVPDPALSTQWVLRVPFVNSTIQVVAEKVTATFSKVPATARFNTGSNTYYPGTNDIDALSITFYETYDYRVSQWLRQWRLLVVHDDGNYGVPAEYKKKMFVQMYSSQGNIAQTLTYHGTWPTDKEAISLSYDDETGRITVDAQFSVDSMSPNW